MSTKSWDCKGCTNLCHMMYNGQVNTYCRVIYDQPDNKGTRWFGDEVRCMDYTTDPEAEDTQVRLWHEPKYKRVHSNSY